MAGLPSRERIALAVDTPAMDRAEHLTEVAAAAGARFVKYGLGLSTATSWEACSELAVAHDLEWVADAKLDDIPHTVADAVGSLSRLERPPFAITVHTTAGIEAMRAAQETAGDTIKILGVTILTSLTEEEVQRIYRVPAAQKARELAEDAAVARVKGFVSSPQEVGMIKHHWDTAALFAMIPGTRSAGAETQDQSRVATPRRAIQDGADLLVIGRQITQAEDPTQAYETLVREIEGAL